ncbi:hypothetical protein LEP1GSC125_4228 [Leptospira mayottensis 200901122]|uniref:Uncharacterized protein n=1 Tax=Leptospira mayottensis 200901122 TaxID=1193010 RepID=A0AA87MP61_9LEPT|nr:hypothetical protein LEP1GSC125_4228 [Leptospira mayottensis 200901122]
MPSEKKNRRNRFSDLESISDYFNLKAWVLKTLKEISYNPENI